MQIENTKNYTKEEVDEINKYHESIGLSIDLDHTKCKKNPGMRAISKLFLNSLWGKFGQSSTLDQREFINDYNLTNLFNINLVSVLALNSLTI